MHFMFYPILWLSVGYELISPFFPSCFSLLEQGSLIAQSKNSSLAHSLFHFISLLKYTVRWKEQ